LCKDLNVDNLQLSHLACGTFNRSWVSLFQLCWTVSRLSSRSTWRPWRPTSCASACAGPASAPQTSASAWPGSGRRRRPRWDRGFGCSCTPTWAAPCGPCGTWASPPKTPNWPSGNSGLWPRRRQGNSMESHGVT